MTRDPVRREEQHHVDLYLSRENRLFDEDGFPVSLNEADGPTLMEQEARLVTDESTETRLVGASDEHLSRYPDAAALQSQDNPSAAPGLLPIEAGEDASFVRDPAVHLLVDGATIRPLDHRDATYSFVVPRGVAAVSLESRSAETAQSGRLGVKVRAITIRSATAEVVIPPDDPRLINGWHDTEHDGITMWRWTDGSARIPWTNIEGPAVVSIRCWPLDEYPIDDGSPRANHALSNTSADASEQLGRAMLVRAANEQEKTARMQWCLGMYSSGSTWIFNAIRSIGNILFPDRPGIAVYAETSEQIPGGWTDYDRILIKSHHTDSAASAFLASHADRIWISIRDPRDAVASASTYLHANFEVALDAVTMSALHCERFIQDSRSVVLRYEDGFIDNPATLDLFASGYSGQLSPLDRDLLFQQSRRAAIETFIKQVDVSETMDDGFRHRVHMETQWHTHHLNRTGEIGRWNHTLNQAQLVEVERRLGPWMERFGYR